jgi:hypothetical protein
MALQYVSGHHNLLLMVLTREIQMASYCLPCTVFLIMALTLGFSTGKPACV